MNSSDHLGFTEALGAAASVPQNPRMSGYPLEVTGFPERTVASCETGAKAAFEKWVRKGARAAATDAEESGDWFEATRLRSLYAHEFGLGYYSWGKEGRKVFAARNSGPGNSYLLYLLIRLCHPMVTEEEVDKMFYSNIEECQRALEWALGNSPPPPGKSQAGAKQSAGAETAERAAGTAMTEPTTLDSP